MDAKSGLNRHAQCRDHRNHKPSYYLLFHALPTDIDLNQISELPVSNGVRVKRLNKDRIEVSPHNMQFKSFASGFAMLLQTLLPPSRRITGC